MNNFEIKNSEPRLRHMVAEYAAFFSGRQLKFGLVWFGVVGVQSLIFFYGPSALPKSNATVLNILAFLNAYFLFGWGGLFLFALMSPLLARLIFPSAIMILELIKLLLTVLQFIIDGAIEWMTKKGFFPLRQDERRYAHILGVDSLELQPEEPLMAGMGRISDELKMRYRELSAKYHPDNVKHLGTEFQILAEQKSKEIREAFRILEQEGWIAV